MIGFGVALHNLLSAMDKRGEAYVVRVDNGAECAVLEHSPHYLALDVNGATLMVNLRNVRSVHVLD